MAHNRKTGTWQQKNSNTQAAPELGPLIRVGIGLLIVFGILLIIGLAPRLLAHPQLMADARSQDAPPLVIEAPVKSPPAFDDVDLPGSIEAIEQTAVVARASGYLKKWMVDIGDKVQAGQTLAVVELPDLDQQVLQSRAQMGAAQAALAQANAYLGNQQAAYVQSLANLSKSNASLVQAQTQLAQARAAMAQSKFEAAQQEAQVAQAQTNLDLANITAVRYQKLLADGAIDRQTTDQEVASYHANLANVTALKASHQASESNVEAFRSAVLSSQANVMAFRADVRSSAAAVTAAAANVRSGEANVQAADSNVGSNQANLERNIVLQQFENVTAPFSGTITARNVDDGALISSGGSAASGSGATTNIGSPSAGATAIGNPASNASSSTSSSGGGQPTSLFSLAQMDQVRVYVNVPQAYVGSVQVGQTANVSVREIPGKVLHATIRRSAGALDPASRTLVVEVRLGNRNGLLRPGMFAEVHLQLPHSGGAVIVPDTALVTNAGGSQLVLVDSDSKIHFQPVTVGRDFGQVMEITSGVHPGQEVVVSPSDALQEGEKVTVNHIPTASVGAN